jgi:hypothetical protein
LKATGNLDFLARECKNDKHSQCDGRWYGLGYEICCSCDCHVRSETQ